MRRKKVPLSVLAAALSACVVESELLNSERIEAQFGTYGIEVISSTDGIRRSNLYSTEGDLRTCRTYAVVRFEDVPESLVGDEHAKILAGSSIGAIFKANGWEIFKETRYVGDLRLPADAHHLRTLMRLPDAPELAIHVYRLYLKKDSYIVEYATIIESHHPDYLTREALTELYLVDAPVRLADHELETLAELLLEAD